MSEPLHNHQEHQPAKYAHEEEDLWNELNKEADVVLEMAAGGAQLEQGKVASNGPSYM